MTKALALKVAFAGALTLTSCVSWNSPSLLPDATLAPGSNTLPRESYRTLKARADAAASGDALRQSIDGHRRFVQRNPRHSEALAALANQWLLYGTAHANSRKEKRNAFLEAKRSCEQAMSTNPGYAGRTSRGAQPWEACEELGEAHMDPMLFWVTSVLYMFREGMVFPQQIFESEWLAHAGRMLDHQISIDREWNGGALLFSKAIVFHAVPPAAGGDPDKARAYLAEAVAVDENWMLSRWGRAKYFLVEPEDREARAADLRAVLALDPERGGETPYWRRYFQADARRMLAGSAPAAAAD